MITIAQFRAFSTNAEELVAQGLDLIELLNNAIRFWVDPLSRSPADAISQRVDEAQRRWHETVDFDPESLTATEPMVRENLDCVEEACPDLVRNDWGLLPIQGALSRRPILTAHHAGIEYFHRVFDFARKVRQSKVNEIRSRIDLFPFGNVIQSQLIIERSQTLAWLDQFVGSRANVSRG